MRARMLQLLLLPLTMVLAGCSYDSLEDQRFTYVVKYAVTSSEAVPTAVDVTYTDETGATVAAPGVIPPWSVQLPIMDYDYTAPYYAELTASAAGLLAGESATVSIILKDYRRDFDEETVARQVVTDPGTGGAALAVELFAPELPLVR